MAIITAELRIRQALHSKVTPAADYIISPGSSFYLKRESYRTLLGPFRVTRVNGKQIGLHPNGREEE